MTTYFITGNKNKFAEASLILSGLEQLDIDLPEIQGVNPQKIIEAKLQEALKHKAGGLIVEDTSLYFECLNNKLPGPLIKWFLDTIGNDGLYNLAKCLGDTKAEARTVIGYAKDLENIYFFEGIIKGEIVFPRGETNFGWDPIFQPENQTKTFAEMSSEEKNSISMRRLAFNELKDSYLL